MTALDEYDRLEAVGVLKRSGEDEGIEVVVTFGEATLTMNALNDGGDTPVTHWSLAAVDLIRETETHAIYSLNAMTEEVLEIEDDTFRRAISKVLQDRNIATSPSKTPKKIVFWGALAGILVLFYLFASDMIAGVAKGMISPERAEVLAGEMLPMIEQRTGPACESRDGLLALERLSARLNPDGNSTLSIHDLGDANVISLPGGRVLINRSVIETGERPEIAAWIAIGIASVIESPAISELFEGQNLLEGLKFLASGQLPKVSKEKAVNRLLAGADVQSPAILDNAAQLLENANISTKGLDAIRTSSPVEATTNQGEPMLSDQDWAALKTICSG